jgi:hypothetical protein
LSEITLGFNGVFDAGVAIKPVFKGLLAPFRSQEVIQLLIEPELGGMFAGHQWLTPQTGILTGIPPKPATRFGQSIIFNGNVKPRREYIGSRLIGG